jgi:hypothetical protein
MSNDDVAAQAEQKKLSAQEWRKKRDVKKRERKIRKQSSLNIHKNSIV